MCLRPTSRSLLIRSVNGVILIMVLHKVAVRGGYEVAYVIMCIVTIPETARKSMGSGLSMLREKADKPLRPTTGPKARGGANVAMTSRRSPPRRLIHTAAYQVYNMKLGATFRTLRLFSSAENHTSPLGRATSRFTTMPGFTLPSPLAGYENATPLPDEKAADGKSYKNPQTGILSDAYEKFTAPLDNGIRGGL
jgi:hypothetical protein